MNSSPYQFKRQYSYDTKYSWLDTIYGIMNPTKSKPTSWPELPNNEETLKFITETES